VLELCKPPMGFGSEIRRGVIRIQACTSNTVRLSSAVLE